MILQNFEVLQMPLGNSFIARQIFAPLFIALLLVTGCSGADGTPDAQVTDGTLGDATPDALLTDGFTSDGAIDGEMESDGGAPTTTIRVHYDTGFGNRIGLQGEAAPLDWNTPVATTWTAGNVWTWETREITAATEFKPVFIDSANVTTYAIGSNWIVHPGETLDVYPFFFLTTGSLDSFVVLGSTLGDREVEVYLPPSYDEPGTGGREYPVLVMQDGQNLFDPNAFFGGWSLNDTMDGLLVGDAVGGVSDVIVVAPHNGATARLYEYTPTSGETDYCLAPGDCGGADVYLDFVENELLPEVRSRYRAAHGRVGIAGSSLGGLVSMYACWSRPTVFDRCGVLSPSFWWDEEWMIAQVDNYTGQKKELRIYLDAGTISDGLANVQMMFNVLTNKPAGFSYTMNVDLLCLIGVDHEHNEIHWRARSPWALEWLYADPTRVQPSPQRPADIIECN